jgi:hypothetical protein
LSSNIVINEIISRFDGMLVAATIAVASIGSANALRVDQGMYTLDTDTSLQWLDLTEPVGESYDAVASSFGGYYAAGYRHVVVLEVAQLFTNGGMTFQNGGNFLVNFVTAKNPTLLVVSR